MPFEFEKTLLWKRTLAPQEGEDANLKVRERLRTAYSKMRDNAAKLVQLIPQDCPGLTVHDVTHLDALWEIADLIAGPDFEINPAEAFVFGASVLIHDSAMSIAAYPNGMEEIIETTEWKDSVYAAFRQQHHKEPTSDEIANPPEGIKEQVIFNVLRALHAKQAEKLVSARWSVPSGNEELCLLEDAGLRNAYGKSIGRIAHSHHWNIERLEHELQKNFGVETELPSEWKLNEIKVACLLRCADAAHIDRRRAPSMLYALTRPSGISAQHWAFQNKLNKPVREAGYLHYSSGADFDLADAPAWWLCFDTIKMIDFELSSAHAVLQEIGAGSFAVSHVHGAGNPTVLARQIRPCNWRPVNAEVRVSNPVNLAQTLGGEHLYGRGAFAPIRELLQNAIDAIRARRRLENRGDSWGKISFTLEKVTENTGDAVWLHVDDNGLGMSERVLVGPLLDFGKSLWNSPLLQEEFPGLESQGINPIGKFGIGFFSVFLLGQNIKVITKPYLASAKDTKVLDFSSIESRPILRNARRGELPIDVSTRISVRIDDIEKTNEEENFTNFRSTRMHRESEKQTIHQTLQKRVRQLVAALDLEVVINDTIENLHFHHGANWKDSPSSEFLEDILAPYGPEVRNSVIKTHENLLANLQTASGENYGRAALFLGDAEHQRFGTASPSLLVSVGGLAYSSRGSHNRHYGNLNYIGVLAGDTNDVTRSSASPNLPSGVLENWASEQARKIDPDRYQISDQVRACHTIFSIGGDTRQLPFCFLGGKFVNYKEFKNIADNAECFYVLLKKSYGENFEFASIDQLTTPFFVNNVIHNLLIIEIDESSKIFEDTLGKKIYENSPYEITLEDIKTTYRDLRTKLIFEQLSVIWDGNYTIKVDTIQVFGGDLIKPPNYRWALVIEKSK